MGDSPPRPARRWWLVGVVVLAGAAVAFALRPADDPGGGRARVGEAAPAFVTSDLDGDRVALRDFEGRPVLLNFWASWCDPCRREFPLLQGVQEAGDVEVLGVVFDDRAASAADFMEEFGATWPGLVDPRGQIAAAYGVAKKPGIPVTVAIDSDGVLRRVQLGELTPARLAELLAAARR